jgi:hypothetical protein
VSYRLSYSLSNIKRRGGGGSELLRSSVTSYRCHGHTYVTNVRTSRLSLRGCSPTRLGRHPDSVRIPTNQYDTGFYSMSEYITRRRNYHRGYVKRSPLFKLCREVTRPDMLRNQIVYSGGIIFPFSNTRLP